MTHVPPWRTVAVMLLCSPSTVLQTGATLRSSRKLSDEANLKAQHRAFADELSALVHTNENDCTSMWGVSMMLSLLYPGAEGDTASQMCDALGFSCPGGESETLLEWSGAASRLGEAYDGVCRSGDDKSGACYSRPPTLRVANSVWIDEGTQVKRSYFNAVGDFLEETDFSSTSAGGIVNEWVKESTEGLIDSIIDEGPIDYDLIAMNSIYLNATWKHQFWDSRTNEDDFYPAGYQDGGAAPTMKAHFMHMVEYFDYSHTALPGFQVVKMKYLTSALSMIVALPAIGYENSDAVPSADVVNALPQLQQKKLALAFPKFQFETTYGESLVEGLKTIGITEAFLGGFCGLFEGSCPFLSLVKQKTYINVHEKGTEAAAVTAGAVATSVPLPEQPTLFMVDRPFNFYIYDEEEDLVLFEGHVGAPEIPEGSVAPLKSYHADSEFWQTNFREDPIAPNVTLPQQTSSSSTSTPSTITATPSSPETTSTMQPPTTDIATAQSTTDATSSSTTTVAPTTPTGCGGPFDACPCPTDACMNVDNFRECKGLEEDGCENIFTLESCPLQFQCGDTDSATTQQSAIDSSTQSTIDSSTQSATTPTIPDGTTASTTTSSSQTVNIASAGDQSTTTTTPTTEDPFSSLSSSFLVVPNMCTTLLLSALATFVLLYLPAW